MKILIAVIVTAAVTAAVLLVVGITVIWPAVGKPPPGKVVRLERPERGSLIEFVTAPGVIEPVKKVEIRSRISARIEEIPVTEGMAVTGGDPTAVPPVPPTLLVRLDDSDLKADLRSAEARYDAQKVQIDVAKADLAAQKASVEGTAVSLAQAERDLARQEGLLETNDVSQSAVDKTRTQVEELKTQLAAAKNRLTSSELALVIAQHNLEAAEANRSRARDSLEYTTVYSPMDGTVTRLHAEAGEMATGSLYNPGTMLLEVGDITQMLLKAEVDEADIAAVEVGQRANVRIQAFPEEIFAGTAHETALASSQGRQGSTFFPVEILLDNEDGRILSGLTADVDIEILTHTEVLKIPSQAVLSRPTDLLPVEIRDSSEEVDKKKTFATVVYRAIDGKAVVTPVKIGKSDATHTILLSGATEEDAIIVGPYKILEELAHGDRIKDERDGEKAAPAGAAAPPAEAGG